MSNPGLSTFAAPFCVCPMQAPSRSLLTYLCPSAFLLTSVQSLILWLEGRWVSAEIPNHTKTPMSSTCQVLTLHPPIFPDSHPPLLLVKQESHVFVLVCCSSLYITPFLLVPAWAGSQSLASQHTWPFSPKQSISSGSAWFISQHTSSTPT